MKLSETNRGKLCGWLLTIMAVLSMMIAGCQAPSDTFTDTFKINAQKTTLAEAGRTLGIAVPVPGYLPEDYKIQEVYLQDDSIRLLISNKEIEKKLVIQSGASGEYQQYESRCPMEINIVWSSQGIPGGLKLPGERPRITPTQGTTIASVIVDRESHHDLWWDWRPHPDEPGMYEIVISASKQISKEELVKVAESMLISPAQKSDQELVRAAYEEITQELFNKRQLYDNISATGYSEKEVILSFYDKADPEIVSLVRSLIDSRVPGVRLVVKENAPAPTPKFPVTTPIPQALSLELQSPQDQSELHTNLVKVTGAVSDPGARVTVNDSEAQVAEEGSFYAFVEMVKGSNTIRVMAERDNERFSRAVVVTFSPPLAVYLDHPYPGEASVDYTQEPVTVTGQVNYPEATVKVNGAKAEIAENGYYLAVIQLKEGSNSIQALATLGEQTDEITYLVGVTSEGKMFAVPGLGSGGPRYHSWVSLDHAVELKPGETQSSEITLEVKKDIQEPDSFDFNIFRVSGEFSQLPLPDEMKLEMIIEPADFTIYPNAIYHFTINIKTSRGLSSGDYFFRWESSYRDKAWMGGSLKLRVQP